MPRTVPLLALALLVVLSGCVSFGGQSGYVLSAERVPADGLADHATVDPDDDARAVLAEVVENGTARTAGWRAVRNGSLVAIDGSYYRIHVRETGETERTVPGVAVVRTNASADVDVGDIPRVDVRGVRLATRFAQVRERDGGTVDDPAYAQPYYYGVGDSRLLSANGTVVSDSGERWRVIVFENVTRVATVWWYAADHVADSEAELRRELAVELSGLSDAEREHFQAAIDEDGTLVPVERMESGDAEAIESMLRKLGFEVPSEPSDVYRETWSTYAVYDGRTYHVEFRYRSGE